jgi:hypothetical protein
VLKTGASATTAVTIDTSQNVTFVGSQTLSGGTANGVLYLNGSKAATSGSALTFDGTNFASTGSLTGSTLKTTRASGAQPEVVLTQTSVASWSIYNPPSSTDLRFYNGSDLLTLASSGNLGIGTSSPATKLDVNGSIRLSATGYIGFGGGTNYIEGDNPNNILRFATNNVNRLIIDASGNLGLGVAPSAWNSAYKVLNFAWASLSSENANQGGMRLNVNAYADSSGYNNWYRSQNAAATSYKQNDGAHSWYTAAYGLAGTAITFTQAMTLDASGNFMVGTTTPLQTASGRGNITINGTSSSILNLAAGGTIAAYLFSNSSGTTFEVYGTNAIQAAGANNITFTTNSNERARIDSSGNLLVGATSSYTAYASIQVTGDNKGVAIRDTTDGSYRAIYNQSGSLYFYNGSNEGYLSSGGAWINASDARLKTNVRDIEYGLSAVMQLKPRSFERVDIDGSYVGFVAQELQELIPEVVSGRPEKQLGVDYGSLVAVAFKAIQEQQALIETLTQRITALEGR